MNGFEEFGALSRVTNSLPLLIFPSPSVSIVRKDVSECAGVQAT
jgi:hypothetical protein